MDSHPAWQTHCAVSLSDSSTLDTRWTIGSRCHVLSELDDVQSGHMALSVKNRFEVPSAESNVSDR
jgi:hypothetical protein